MPKVNVHILKKNKNPHIIQYPCLMINLKDADTIIFFNSHDSGTVISSPYREVGYYYSSASGIDIKDFMPFEGSITFTQE
jgi:hypothetical protein